jgi:hypothetical protein
VQNLGEVDAERNGINVHEKKIAPELALKPIVNSPGVAGTIVGRPWRSSQNFQRTSGSRTDFIP